MPKNHYEILGVPRTASDLEIKSAYHKLARRYHPDKAESPEQATKLEAEFSRISTAYNTLKDKDKRLVYDRTLQAEAEAKGDGGSAIGRGGSSAVNKAAGSGNFVNAATDANRASVARRAFVKGTQTMSGGDYAKASELFEMAIKNNDREAMYHAKLALALLRSHRSFNRATEAAKRAIELDPYNSDYRIILAELYEGANIKSMAISTYEEILKWDPSNDRARQALHVLKPEKMNLFAKLFGRKG